MLVNCNKQTVLIVDDSTINIKILENLLKKDYEIKVAKHANEALYITANNEIDLILLDIVMPEISGYEICKILKKNKATKDIPIIFVTALSKDEDEEYGLSLGAIDYISKPFNSSIAKVRIDNHLKLKKYSDRLKMLNMLDGLTSVYNKKIFDENLIKAWEKSILTDSNIGVLLMDIDYFKRFNDTYGHLKGDDCLKLISKELNIRLMKEGTFLYRWGGEEFATIIRDKDINYFKELSNELRKLVYNLKIPNEKSDISDYTTISIGISIANASNKLNPYDLVSKSDEALYLAKENGRNKIEIKEYK